MAQLHLHSIGDASPVHPSAAAAGGAAGLAALLVPQILLIFSVVAPDHPGDFAALGATMELHHELLDAA